MGQCKCYAIAVDQERLAMWKRIFPPDGHVPITCPIPIGKGNLAGDITEFYLVDLDRVSPAALEDLIHEMAEKFNLSPREVRKDIQEKGVPIKADGVMTSWCQIHALAAMPDQDFEQSTDENWDGEDEDES